MVKTWVNEFDRNHETPKDIGHRPMRINIRAKLVAAEKRVAGKERVGLEPVFLKGDGSPWLADHQSEPMAEAYERAKITPAINFHGLRHTWASHAVMNGMPLMDVARNLGHSDTRMVEKQYGHLAPSYISDAVRTHAPRFGIPSSANVKPLRRMTPDI